MASLINDINNYSLYNTNTFESESKMLAEINRLRQQYEKDYSAYKDDLRKLDSQKELRYYQDLNKKKLAQVIEFRKKVDAFENKQDKAAFEKFKKDLKKKQQAALKEYEKELKLREEAEAKLEAKSKAKETIFSGKTDVRTKLQAARNLKDELGNGALADALISGISNLAKMLDNQITEIASYQSKIDTRLYGSGKRWEGLVSGQGIANRLSGIIGVSPLIQTKQLYKNVETLVDKGISYNLEQRAFLETIAGKIATTFHVDNQNLLQLIRVQQADTTAARLGLEANLNKYFNSMYQTTEYLSDSFDSVSSSLYEAISQMTATAGVGFEYQVQKWLGSLYSVGMSQGAVSNIASALGMLGSGNISGLAGNTGMQNLLVMAASRAGTSYSNLLTGGLTANTTNQLLASMVNYLADIAKATEDNKVVRAQYANIFGLSVSDLTAMANLAPSIKDITGVSLDYAGSMNELAKQSVLMWTRTSTGEMLENAWSNLQYSISTGIASNPALYAIWKVAGALEDTVGGIALPDIKVMGSGVNLQTTVADLMRVGALSGGLLGGLGNIIAAGSGGGVSALGMLNSLNILGSKVSTVTRGTGLESMLSGVTTSASTFVGNVSGSDIYETSMAGVEETKQEEMAKAKESSDDVTTKVLDEHITDIYNLLASTISGGAMTVRMENYGLSGGFTGTP